MRILNQFSRSSLCSVVSIVLLLFSWKVATAEDLRFKPVSRSLVETRLGKYNGNDSAKPPRELFIGDDMLDTRRCFLKNLAGVSSFFLIFQAAPPIPTPRRRTPVDPPTPAERQDAENPVGSSSSTSSVNTGITLSASC